MARDRYYANAAEKQSAYRERQRRSDRVYETDAEKQAAYRKRQAAGPAGLAAAQARAEKKAQAHTLGGYEDRAKRALEELAAGERASGEVKLRASIIRAQAILRGEVI